jgi:hypothetical protein
LGEYERKKTAVRVYVAGENRRRILEAWGTTQAEQWTPPPAGRMVVGGLTVVSTLPHAIRKNFGGKGTLKYVGTRWAAAPPSSGGASERD